MRALGLDYGAHTVGVALSDPTGTLATGREIIRRDKESRLRDTLRRIEEIVRANEVDRVVLGLPLYLDGRISPRAQKTMEFREKLEKRLGLPVIMQDERLSSVEAEEILKERGIPRKDWKEHIDALAAEVILQDYLNGKA